MSGSGRLAYIDGTNFQFRDFTDGIVSCIRENIGTTFNEVKRHKN